MLAGAVRFARMLARLCLALGALLVPVAAWASGVAAADGEITPPAEPAVLKVPSRTTEPPLGTATPIGSEDDLVARAWLDGEGRLAVGPRNQPRTTTLDAALQERLQQILETYQTPYGAVVVMDPNSGRVLAMAEHSQARPELRGLAVKAVFPAASIFKLVTASALLEEGVDPDDTECGHGGKRRLSLRNIADGARDTACFTLSQALAFSANTVFAKLTIKHLDPQKLLGWAEKFRFNRRLQFAQGAEISLAAVPGSGLPFAQTGAGFGDVYLSPLHGAAIAAIAANRGVWREPLLFDDQVAPEPSRVMSAAHAEALVGMMEETVTAGTARRIFRERGYRVRGAVGKTGSLADKKPFRDYSWFVGFAPKDDPQVAVAAVIVNDPIWRIRATWLGREAMRIHLENEAKKLKLKGPL